MRLAILAVMVVPAACSMLPIGGDELDTTTTGSVHPVPAPPAAPPAATAPERTIADALDPSDWETIRDMAAEVADARSARPIDWSNPETGSNGKLAPVAALRDREDGSSCRAFSLEVSDVRGVRRYRGDACRLADGQWQLFDVTPEDRALL